MTHIRGIDGKNGKFIAAQAGDDIRFPERLSENMRRIDQGFISFFMTQCIVDPFQAITIDECELQRLLGSVCGF
jgi:hypothetical protein